MGSFQAQVDQAILAKTDEELEEAALLFEDFLGLIQEEDFDDFESLYRLAQFLVQGYWPDSGMFAEISSQLFAEYEFGAIDWIWEDPSFQEYALKFLESDIHFGCFVLTEERSNEKFTLQFAEQALNEDCQICEEMGEGWLSPKAYICENETSTPALLLKFSEIAFKNLLNGTEDERYESVMILRSLAGNPNTPREVLEKLAEINEISLRHEIRNANAEMDMDDATKDANVSFKAKQTLENISS
jgi:hypothetical protein